jgi:1,4-dihydroxy-2-naphthoate octaprenyltransferase
VRIAIVLLAIVATVLGLVLTHNRGWPVLVIGISSLLAALAYMGGPRPIAYSPFGELTVFVFFGLVAVIGTEWALTGDFTITTVLAAIGIGGLAAAALAVNNHRDIAHDKLVGRRTFAVLAGTEGSRRLYAMLLFGPFLLVPFIALSARAPTLLLPLVLLASAPQLWRDFVRCPPGIAFNDILHRTFRLELTYACMLAVGAVLGRLTA